MGERITRVFAALILSLRDSFLQQHKLNKFTDRDENFKDIEWWFLHWLASKYLKVEEKLWNLSKEVQYLSKAGEME